MSSPEDEKNPFLDCTTSEIGASPGAETLNASCVENYFSNSCLTRKHGSTNIELLSGQKSPAQKKLGTPKKGKPATPQLFLAAKNITPSRPTLTAHKRGDNSMMLRSPPSRMRIHTLQDPD